MSKLITKPLSLLRKVANYPQRRFTASRPGSVLILVIALLVLLALIGTAYISTTRVERYTSHQNEANTQIDLLMDGLVNMIEGAVVSDLTDQSSGNYRSPQTLTGGGDSYINIDSVATKTWLASRIPDLRDNTKQYIGNADSSNRGINGIGDPGGWEGISWPLITATNQQYQFDLPNTGGTFSLGKPWTAWNSTATYNMNDVVTFAGPSGIGFYTSLIASNNNNIPSAPASAAWSQMIPPPKVVNRFEPTFTTLNGVTVPAFILANPIAGALPGLFMAADTDNDGVADAMLWKLPVGVLDGVTYYAAYRVVDNNAAINVNTALSLAQDYDASGNPLKAGAVVYSPSLFTSNVGLLELLDPTPGVGAVEFSALNGYRFNNTAANPVGFDPSLSTPMNSAMPPIQQPGIAFLSQGDSLYHQLGRRVSNPGYNGSKALMQAVSLNDSLTLASQFCIQNTSNPSMLESTWLTKSVDNVNGGANYSAPIRPYDPANTGTWFAANFDYTSSANTQFQLRPLLTSYNGAVNRVGDKIISSTSVLPTGTPANVKLYDVINPGMTPFNPPVADPAATYDVGQWVKYFSTSNNTWGVYRCLLANTKIGTNAPDVATRQTPSANWARESWNPTSTKTSINTATFPELWRSFYSVMSDKWNTAPNTTTAHVGAAMFKSSLREPATNALVPALTDIQMVQLRAAIAAVNAMDLRDTDNDITSRTITLYDDLDSKTNPTPRAPVTTTVFGSEKQPFITKVIVVQLSATTWWVGIELYNPYVELQYPTGEVTQANPVTFYMGAPPSPAPANQIPIGLGCRIGLVTRTAAAAPVLNELNGAPVDWTTAPPPALGPGQYILLASSATLPPGVSAADPTRVVVVAGLDALAGTAAGGAAGEIVLFRTRSATGVQATKNTAALEPDPTKQYNETNLWENVPFDQFDMTGTPAFTANSVYYYGRPTQAVNPTTSAAARDYWKCVYPLKPTDIYTPVTGGEPIPVDAAATGAAPLMVCQGDPALAGIPWHQIQVNNVDWPAPHTLNATTSIYPVAGFARNGDILQTPYIGAYSMYTTVPTVLPATMVEINSVTMDALYAEDSTTIAAHNAAYDDPTAIAPATTPAPLPATLLEQIGRFCPLTATPTTLVPAGTNDPYGWASRLFDYFTVQAPHDDYLPSVDPESYVRNGGTLPDATANVPGGVANVGEDSVPVQGLININTADWKVLSMLPLVRAANGSVDVANTKLMAQAIVRYREKNGPFQSIFDLNKVIDTTSAATPQAGFQNGYGMMDFTYTRTVDVDGRQGNLTPNDPANLYPSFASVAPFSPIAGVTADFKEKFLAMTRISNMITTRSDTFTCYAMIQGYRGTTLVAQRRTSFIIDRSNIGFTLDATGNRQMVTTPNVYKVPSN
jgi:Helix-hairpin-helix motif